MATDPRYQRGAAVDGGSLAGPRRSFEELAVAEDHDGWVSRSRVFLTPIAAPSIMGLFGAGSLATDQAGGWLFVVSAAAAWLTAGAMVLEHAFGRTIIPLGKWSARANIPGAQATDPIAYPAGMPGVRVGQ
jgi:hypothetical protein